MAHDPRTDSSAPGPRLGSPDSDALADPKGAPPSSDDGEPARALRTPTTVADIMTREVISVSPDTSVREIAETLVLNRISAVPVIDGEGRLVGIVSEGDLLRRAEIGTERDRAWWIEMFRDRSAAASDYVKAHGRKAKHVMTPRLATATEDMPLAAAARLLEKRRVNRLPVLRDNRVVGIVSRADLVRAVARSVEAHVEAATDEAIEKDVTARIRATPVANTHVQVTARSGVVNLWGLVYSDTERKVFHVAAENTPGVLAINDHLFQPPLSGL